MSESCWLIRDRRRNGGLYIPYHTIALQLPSYISVMKRVRRGAEISDRGDMDGTGPCCEGVFA